MNVHWDDLSIDPSPMAGKTIKLAEADSQYGRSNTITLHFTDGTQCQIGWWASNADDGGLELSQNDEARDG